MLRRVAELEETTAKLPRGGPLDDSEIEEIKRQIAKLKATVPEGPPIEAVGAQTKLGAVGKRVLESLATDAAKWPLTAASTALWVRYGDQLTDLARSIGEWIASLPLPPLPPLP